MYYIIENCDKIFKAKSIQVANFYRNQQHVYLRKVNNQGHFGGWSARGVFEGNLISGKPQNEAEGPKQSIKVISTTSSELTGTFRKNCIYRILENCDVIFKAKLFQVAKFLQ